MNVNAVHEIMSNGRVVFVVVTSAPVSLEFQKRRRRRRSNSSSSAKNNNGSSLIRSNNNTTTTRVEEFTHMELFSGIGGMRLALKRSNVLEHYDDLKCVAVDNNAIANEVYRRNFDMERTVMLEGNIESMLEKSLMSLFAKTDLLTMSPPCQPYTRTGKKEHGNDKRSTALAKIIDTFESSSSCVFLPKRILVENVVGFENGKERERLIALLEKNSYFIKEFVGLSPEDIGMPCKRPRYYLIARAFELGPFNEPKTIAIERRNIKEFLSSTADDNEEEHSGSLLLDVKKIEKYWRFFDIVHCGDGSEIVSASTFTSGYAKTVFSGSILLDESGIEFAKRDVKANNAFRLIKRDSEETDEDFAAKVQPHLRYFSPREICRLHGYEDGFNFGELSERKKYKLIGNGISVSIVSNVLKYLFNK